MEIHRRTNDGNLVLAEKNPFGICIIYEWQGTCLYFWGRVNWKWVDISIFKNIFFGQAYTLCVICGSFVYYRLLCYLLHWLTFCFDVISIYSLYRHPTIIFNCCCFSGNECANLSQRFYLITYTYYLTKQNLLTYYLLKLNGEQTNSEDTGRPFLKF